jgi:hypothetical protein
MWSVCSNRLLQWLTGNVLSLMVLDVSICWLQPCRNCDQLVSPQERAANGGRDILATLLVGASWCTAAEGGQTAVAAKLVGGTCKRS